MRSHRRLVQRVLLSAAVTGIGLPLIFIYRSVIAGWFLAALVGGRYLGGDGVILQRGQVDCGVAAMQMILVAHGLPPSRLDSLDRAVLRRKRGLSMLELQHALASLGLQTEGRQMNRAALARAPLPAIVNFPDHFVVGDRRTPNGAWDIRDPSIGRMRLDSSSFAALWTGKVLVVRSRR